MIGTVGLRETRGMATTADVGLERYRAMRRELERSVLPLATSIDGRRFSFQASLHDLELRLGGYVLLETPDGLGVLGQVLDLRLAWRDAGGIDIAVDDGDAG